MHVVVIVLGAWFAVSIPVALACCALLRAAPPGRAPAAAPRGEPVATVTAAASTATVAGLQRASP